MKEVAEIHIKIKEEEINRIKDDLEKFPSIDLVSRNILMNGIKDREVSIEYTKTHYLS